MGERIAGAVVVAGLAAVAVLYCGRLQLYRRCTSPDGSWRVELYRSRSAGGVDVVLRAAMADGTATLERTLDVRDTWMEVEERYAQLACENEVARTGPSWWNGRELTYFVIRKEEVASQR